MARRDGEPKVGDKMQLPVSTKRDGGSINNVYEQYTYTKNGWADSKGFVVNPATQIKITQAFMVPVGTMNGQYKYLGNGRWTDTHSYEGNVVAPTKAKRLYGVGKVERGDEYTPSPETAKTPQKPTTTTTTTTGKGLVGGGKKEEAPVEETPARDNTVPEPIQTKSVLNGEALAGIFKRSDERAPQLKDSNATSLGTEEKQPGAFDDLAGVAEYLPDFFKLGMGLLGASEQLPEYQIPKEFVDYKNYAKEMSDQGLTAEELAKAYQDTERAYAYDTKAIRDMSGGRPGLALANLGRATDALGQRYGAINAADAAMRRENRLQYGSVLGTYLGLDRTMFEDRRQIAMMNKEAGANLAADALSNIDERREYNRSYGNGSIYEQYMQQLNEGVGLQNDILRYQKDNPPEVIAPNIQTVPMSPVPNFYGTYYGMGGGK